VQDVVDVRTLGPARAAAPDHGRHEALTCVEVPRGVVGLRADGTGTTGSQVGDDRRQHGRGHAEAAVVGAGRVTLLVHRTSPTVRHVGVEGRVLGTGPATEDEVRAMASRYLPADRVGAHVGSARAEHVIRMRPERWLSSDLGPA
jgi:hypothetical protein